MNRRLLLIAAAIGLGTPMTAFAQDSAVGAAQAAGIVGERFDGYLGLASTTSDALRRQVASVNLKRRSLYAQLAARRGVSPDEVGITAACQLFSRVEVGEAYLLADKVWRRRAPGERAPHPDYCG